MPNRCVVMGHCSYPDKDNYITLFGYPRAPVVKRKWTKVVQSTGNISKNQIQTKMFKYLCL